ncbi:MAG: M4 family metallopeptidase [Mycobacteriaceae bacterium]
MSPCCAVVPPYLLQRLAQAREPQQSRFAASVAEAATRTLAQDETRRSRRASAAGPKPPGGGGLRRTIADAGATRDLPGRPVRTEGASATGDPAADEAYDGLGDTYALFDRAYGRSSLDGQGLALRASVHYDRRYDNAFWDGEQMVFGDGDGEVFDRFTRSVTVIGHELTHGFTQSTAALVYSGQSGALNESVSDVFGVLVEQHARGESADQASWLVGEGLFLPAVQGRALRDMAAPGTAYDDDVLGRDPQPATMAAYVHTPDDYGGVHLNSGIPNHAFALAAVSLGGNAWERAGQVWFDVMTGGTLAPDVDLAEFATATVAAGGSRYGQGSDVALAVRSAWTQVGVDPGSATEKG